MSFYFSFTNIDDAFGSDYSAQTSFDPFSDESDVDRTGLQTDLDSLEEHDPSQPDSDFEDEFEDLDEDDTEVGEDIDEEENINEVDLDFDDQTEPDFNPEDDAPLIQDPTDISHEDGNEVQVDDAPFDEWDETSPYDEISQEDDILQDDNISQIEEVGTDEPLYFPDPDDLDADLSDNIEVDIQVSDEQVNEADIDEMVDWIGQWLSDSAKWIDAEPPLDFTTIDTSSFHETSDGYDSGDNYAPPDQDLMADDMIELGNLADDVFVDLFDDGSMGDPFFSWYDSFS